MNQDLSLHQRRRPPTADELDGIPWLRLLLPHLAPGLEPYEQEAARYLEQRG